MRRIVLSLVLILAFAAVAPAQTIWEPNALVVYFDESATQRSWYGTGPVTAYIVAGPLQYWDGSQTVPYGVLNRWAAYLLLDPSEYVADIVVRPRGDAWPAAYEMTNPPWWLDMEVFLDTPLSLSDLTVIAEIDVMVLSNEATAIHIQGATFHADGRLDGFASLFNGNDGPMSYTDHVANINAEAPVQVEATTWGGLKALFD